MSHIQFLSHADPQMFENARVLVRLDLNVPVENGQVVDDFRIERALPTIRFLQKHGASVTIATHLGENGDRSIAPIEEYLMHKVGPEVKLLGNLRADPREKGNDHHFAEELAKGFQFFVNDAFAAMHREHASIVGIPAFLPSFAGFLVEEEVKNLSNAFRPEHPFVLVLGGAKFETKLPVIEKFIDKADEIFISGALCIDFFRAQGLEVGTSKTGDNPELVKPFLGHPKIKLPVDLVLDCGHAVEVRPPSGVEARDRIVDVGPRTVAQMVDSFRTAKTVVWNGPLGWYEGGFKEATEKTANELSATNAFSLIGGGDTLAALKAQGLLGSFGFVSTGGGAMLEFLANETLPGLEALKTEADCCQ